MTYGGASRKVSQDILMKNLGDQPHSGMYPNSPPIACSNAAAFLSPMLKGKQRKKGKPGYLLTGGINTKDAARLV
jgi:hypothetical protein